MSANLQTDTKAVRSYRHIVERKIKNANMKPKPPIVCEYCRGPFEEGQLIYKKQFFIDEETKRVPLHKLCIKYYVPREHGAAVTKSKSKTARTNRPVSSKGIFKKVPKFIRTLCGLTDAQIAMLFLYAHTAGGANSPYQYDRMDYLLGEMRKVVKSSPAESQIIDRIIDALDYPEVEFEKWRKDFQCASTGTRMIMATTDISQAFVETVRGLNFIWVQNYFSAWIQRSFKSELEKKHKAVYLSDKSLSKDDL